MFQPEQNNFEELLLNDKKLLVEMKSLSRQMNKRTKRGQDYHSGAHSTQPQAYNLCRYCTTTSLYHCTTNANRIPSPLSVLYHYHPYYHLTTIVSLHHPTTVPPMLKDTITDQEPWMCVCGFYLIRAKQLLLLLGNLCLSTKIAGRHGKAMMA